MNCALFAKMNQVFSLKNKTLKNTGKMEKVTGKVREFCQSGKVGTLNISTFFLKFTSTYCTSRCKWKHEKSPDIAATENNRTTKHSTGSHRKCGFTKEKDLPVLRKYSPFVIFFVR